MSVAGKPAPHFEFGVFDLDVGTGDLRKHGIRIKLQDQPRQILSLLLEHAGEVVTREQIQHRLWPDDTYVDFDNAINSAVRKLRDALGDTAESPRFVETLSRRGYRFIVPVSRRSERDATPGATFPTRRMGPIIGAAMVAVVLATAVALWVLRKASTTDTGGLRVTSLTASTGFEFQPSFSPDGTRVAFSTGGDDGKYFAIYVKSIGSGEPVRLTKDAVRELSPAWSPDGRWIAAIRDLGRENAVMLIPASGGQSQVLARVRKASPGEPECPARAAGPPCWIPFQGSLLTWSPDGKSLYTSGKSDRDSALGLVRISLETRELQSVTTPPEGTAGDVSPAISPDGRALAFVRMSTFFAGDIYIASISGAGQLAGGPKRITADGSVLSAPVWTPDGRELIFSSNRRGQRELWRISASGSGEPVALVGMGENPSDVAISRQGRRLVYGRAIVNGSLWKIPLESGKAGQPVRVASATSRFLFPHFSPDAKRIAFQSRRSGLDEIWVCDADGSNSVQLTSFGKGMSGTPRWSPDGRRIAFDSNVTGNWEIYVISAEGGSPVRLTSNKATDVIPKWSRDGNWIYFTSTRTGRLEIWRIRSDGTSEMQITKTGGWVAVESADSKYLYYKSSDAVNGDVCKLPLGGGSPSTVLVGVWGREFTVTKGGIYFQAGMRPTELRYFDFESNSTRVIAQLIETGPYATVSSDEHWALYARSALGSTNLMLVENFR